VAGRQCALGGAIVPCSIVCCVAAVCSVMLISLNEPRTGWCSIWVLVWHGLEAMCNHCYQWQEEAAVEATIYSFDDVMLFNEVGLG